MADSRSSREKVERLRRSEAPEPLVPSGSIRSNPQEAVGASASAASIAFGSGDSIASGSDDSIAFGSGDPVAARASAFGSGVDFAFGSCGSAPSALAAPSFSGACGAGVAFGSDGHVVPDIGAGVFDLLIIGGGVNGAGIARDAQGRGWSVCLCEANDFASGTSSASTKLLHGGLRYLEYFEFGLVRKALAERETLLKNMPHISRPMRFALPLGDAMKFEADTPASRLLSILMPWTKGKRPRWIIRFGLFLYDHMGGRRILPPTRTLDLSAGEAGIPLKPQFRKAYEYSDCWVDDSRLVILNLRDAERKGAALLRSTPVERAEFSDGEWKVLVRDSGSGERKGIRARRIVNASGPWIDSAMRNVFGRNRSPSVRLVRGSHVVVRRECPEDRAYFFQNEDRRIIFALPCGEGKFTLIGTTDEDHGAEMNPPEISDSERSYLLGAANEWLRDPLGEKDIAWTYSGVRALHEGGDSSARASPAPESTPTGPQEPNALARAATGPSEPQAIDPQEPQATSPQEPEATGSAPRVEPQASISARSVTRDYVLELDAELGDGTLLHVFGGKITTYRVLAEDALEALGMKEGKWTETAPLPGGDFPVDGFEALLDEHRLAYPFLDDGVLLRLTRAHGSLLPEVLGKATCLSDLGEDFGEGLYERELIWMAEREWARCAEDVLFRRTRLGIGMTQERIEAVGKWFGKREADS